MNAYELVFVEDEVVPNRPDHSRCQFRLRRWERDAMRAEIASFPVEQWAEWFLRFIRSLMGGPIGHVDWFHLPDYFMHAMLLPARTREQHFNLYVFLRCMGCRQVLLKNWINNRGGDYNVLRQITNQAEAACMRAVRTRERTMHDRVDQVGQSNRGPATFMTEYDERMESFTEEANVYVPPTLFTYSYFLGRPMAVGDAMAEILGPMIYTQMLFPDL